MTALPVPLLPFIRDDFGLDYTQAGLVISAFSLSYGLGQLPAGWLADRWGVRILITIGIAGVAVAGILVGLSQTFIMMIVFLALMGVAGGGYHPSAAPLISSTVEPNKRGQVLGFHVIGGSGSFFLAPLVAAGIAATWGWRSAFIGLAVPALIFGIIFYVVLGRRAAMGKAQAVMAESQEKTPFPPGHWRRLVAFMVLSTFIGATTIAIISFVPLFLVDQFGVSKETAAIFLALIYSAGLWASPLGGYLSDRLGRVRVMLVMSLITGPAIYLLNLAPYSLGIGAVLLFIGMSLYIRMPVSEAYIIGQTPPHRRSTILGIYYFSSMEIGGVLTPVLGSLIDRFGFYTSFTITGAVMVAVTLLCSVFLWRSRD